MSDNRSSMKIWMMAAAAIVVVGGGLIVLIWFIMSGRTSSNSIVVPQLTPEKIPSLIEDIKSQNGQSLTGLSTIISLFDSNKKIEAKETPEKDAEEFFTKNPEIAFKIRQALDYKVHDGLEYFNSCINLSIESQKKICINIEQSQTLIADVLHIFQNNEDSEDESSDASVPDQDSEDESSDASVSDQDSSTTELPDIIVVSDQFENSKLFGRAVLLNNGWRKDFVRFFNQHLDKNHRLDIEKYCPWLTSEQKFCDNLNSFFVLTHEVTTEALITRGRAIYLRASALESNTTYNIKKPDDLTEILSKKYPDYWASKKSKFTDLNNNRLELSGKLTQLQQEISTMKSKGSIKAELEKKEQDLCEVSQDLKIHCVSIYLIITQYFLDMEKFAWWSFISSKVMTAAPRATVSALQNVLPVIKKLDESIKSDTDLTEEICAKLIYGNIEDLDKTLMSEEIEVNEKSVGKKDKDSAENEKNNQLSTKQKGK